MRRSGQSDLNGIAFNVPYWHQHPDLPFQQNIPEKSRAKLNDIFLNHFNISVITKMEFLGFKEHTKKSFKKSRAYLEHANIINLNDQIVDTVIDLKLKHAVKLPDAIIAATAIDNKLTIVTRNEDDFKNVKCKIYNPFE